MKFTPVNREDIPKSTKPSSKSATVIREFMNAGVDVGQVELDPDNDKPVESIRSSLDNYIQRHNLPLRVFTSAGQLYLDKFNADGTPATLPVNRPKRVATPEQLAAREARKAAKAAAKAAESGTTPVVDEAANVAESGATEPASQPTSRRQKVA